MNSTEKASYKEKNRIQKQLSRQKIKDQLKESIASSSSTCSPYQCSHTFGKAFSNSMRALPKSPTKRKVVVQGLANHNGDIFKNKIEKEKKLSSDISKKDKLVIDFYYRSDIVYAMPGLKDEITVWKNGKKKKLRKYFLTMFLKEAHAIFQSTYGEVMHFSAFCKLRSINVLLLEGTPVDQCKYKLHKNFRLLLKALCISYNSSSCWLGDCLQCKIKVKKSLKNQKLSRSYGRSYGSSGAKLILDVFNYNQKWMQRGSNRGITILFI